ncbi:MAG: hypothetical protein ACTSRG_10745 [Candidatus Helarchaeota archaeon]
MKKNVLIEGGVGAALVNVLFDNNKRFSIMNEEVAKKICKIIKQKVPEIININGEMILATRSNMCNIALKNQKNDE